MTSYPPFPADGEVGVGAARGPRALGDRHRRRRDRAKRRRGARRADDQRTRARQPSSDSLSARSNASCASAPRTANTTRSSPLPPRGGGGPPRPRSAPPRRAESRRRRCRTRRARATARRARRPRAASLAVARRMISAEVGPPSSIVAAWITQRAASPRRRLDRLAEPDRRALVALGLDLGAAGARDRPGDAAAVPQLGVGGVRDRVDFERGDVGLLDLDRGHRAATYRRRSRPIHPGRIVVRRRLIIVAIRRDHAEALAAELRARLVERRRAEAAAGRPAAPTLEDGGRASWSRTRRPSLVAEAARARAPRADPARHGRARAAGGAARRPRVEEVMVNGAERGLRRARAGGSSRPTSASPPSRSCATRSSASWLRSAAGSTSSARWSTRGSADGSRVNVVIPPLAVDGPAVSIRRFGARAARARTSWSSRER